VLERAYISGGSTAANLANKQSQIYRCEAPFDTNVGLRHGPE